MLSAEDLKTLRAEGIPDDVILEGLSKNAPDHAKDFETLKGEGIPSSTILEGIAGSPKAAPKSASPAPKKNESFLGALGYGAGTSARGLGSTAEHAGLGKTGKFLQSAAKAISPDGYDPAGPKFKALSPSTWGYAPRALVEGLPRLGADLIGGAVGGIAGPAGAAAGFAGMDAAQTFGPNLDARQANNGGAELTGTDYAAAGGASLAEAALNRLGISRAASAVPKGAGLQAIGQGVTQTARAGAENAALGAAGNVAVQAGQLAGTDKGLAKEFSGEAVLNDAVLSGGVGAGVRAARLPGDVVNATKMKSFDPEAAGRVVRTADDLGLSFKSPKAAGEELTRLNDHYKVELDKAVSELKSAAKSAGDDIALDVDTTLKSALGALNKGEVLKGKELSTLRQNLSGKAEGERVLGLMDERQVWNKAASRGRVMDNGKWAGGVSSTRLLEALNPLEWVRSKYAASTAGLAGIAGVGAGAQAAALGALTVKGLGGLSALQGGSYLLDRALGMRNPGGEFMNRFRGLERYQDLSGRPSLRQDAADNAAQAEAIKLNAAADAQSRREANAENQRFNARTKANDQTLDAALKANEKFDANTRREANADNSRRDALARAQAKMQDEALKQNETFDAKVRQEAHSDNSRRDALARAQAKMLDEAFAENTRRDTKVREEALLENTQRDATAKAQASKMAQADAEATVAQAALEKLLSPKVTPTMTAGFSKTQKALRKAQNAQEAKKGSKGAKTDQKASSANPEAPKATVVDAGETITIQHNGQTVERPKEGIRSVKAYVAKTKSRMEAREAFTNALEKAAGKSPVIDTLLTKLNSASHSWKDAQGHISELINELPEASWSKAWDVVSKHEARIRGTYGES